MLGLGLGLNVIIPNNPKPSSFLWMLLDANLPTCLMIDWYACVTSRKRLTNLPFVEISVTPGASGLPSPSFTAFIRFEDTKAEAEVALISTWLFSTSTYPSLSISTSLYPYTSTSLYPYTSTSLYPYTSTSLYLYLAVMVQGLLFAWHNNIMVWSLVDMKPPSRVWFWFGINILPWLDTFFLGSKLSPTQSKASTQPWEHEGSMLLPTQHH